ncbi:hypothetical protein K438DRAFT_1590987 [Mycena galopus ATCC 62051]|nr:hypothetical protein K438DRAFT_1590987 [Mycena galopus ATCC 62051]
MDTDAQRSTDSGEAFPPLNGSVPFPGAAQPLPTKGESFMDWINNDEFSAQRRENHWYPFASKAEWELASFLLRSGMTMKDIDDFLDLQLVRDCLPLSFKSANELRGRVEKLPAGPQWKSKEIVYEGYSTKAPLVLYYRDPLECIQFLLKNPLIHDHLDLVPTKKFRDGKHIYDEWITGDGAWEMQAALPAGATLIGTIATSDKTNISVHNGDRVAHPLLVSLANIKMAFLMKALNHAFMMVALLPVAKFLCDERIRGMLERRLFHHCYDIVFAPLKVAAHVGHPMSDSLGRRLNCHTPLAACIQVNATYHPWDQIFQYLKESKDRRLSGVHLPFWRDWPLSTNPARFLTPEPLHQLHKGFHNHELQWCINILGKEEFDFRLKVMQPRIGFRHFKEGVTGIKQLGGHEHRELQRHVVAIIADVAPPKVVRSIRALVDFRYIAQVPETDDETIGRLNGCLDEFDANKQSVLDAGGRTQAHFKIPKFELFRSLGPFTKWAGVPMQFTADVTEKTHSKDIKVPARTETNHRDYDPQIVRYLDRAEKMRLFDLSTEIISSDLDPGADDDKDDEATEGPSETGESSRPIRNLFRLAHAHCVQYPHLESRMFTTSSTAFCFNRTPHHRKISIEEAAELYKLPDLRPALGDYLRRLQQNRRSSSTPIIGGPRRCLADCDLPFTHLEVWYNVRVQVKTPHQYGRRVLAAQNLQARPPDSNTEWIYGRYDTVLLCNDQQSEWPGKGFREGLAGHIVAQIRLLMRPLWDKKSEPLTTAYLMYAQRFDIVTQPNSATGREQHTDMYLLKRALRTGGVRMGDVVEVDNIRIPAELVPWFGKEADSRFSAYNCLEFAQQVRLNKHSTKELHWIMDSVAL